MNLVWHWSVTGEFEGIDWNSLFKIILVKTEIQINIPRNGDLKNRL